MDEINNKIEELIDALNDSDIVKDLLLYKDIILKDKCLLDNINKYQQNNDLELKKIIYENNNYKKYINCYNNLFYIVMDINKRINKLIDNRMCNN